MLILSRFFKDFKPIISDFERFDSSIRNSSGAQNAKTHSPFSRHLRAILTDGGWIRQSYVIAVTQVFYEKKKRRDNRIYQSHRVFEKHEKNMIKIGDKNKIKIE